KMPWIGLPHTTPHLLLSDIGMPDMDGYELLQQIRSTNPHGQEIMAIALTAYAGEVNQQEALDAGFQCHIAKPVEPNDLVTTIIHLFDGRLRVQ
ncbi:MAG: response regulator, partial [Leptolyngbyaceae cyanobacterium SL_7_1]|nr:response regulator [Leptolyngbyaceae cyanobacterium SL_7_1]